MLCLCTYVIYLYTVFNMILILFSTCFNNLPQNPGKFLYAKLLRTDPYPISPHQVGSGQEMSWGTNISGGEIFTSFGQRTFRCFQK